MKHRLELDKIIKELCPGVAVYFQPPSGEQMEYPCIRYEFDGNIDIYADNKKYMLKETYKITVMDRKPTSKIPDQIASLDRAKLISHYCSGGITHDMFTITFN